nr:hypothetical protein [Allomuricauda sp.]
MRHSDFRIQKLIGILGISLPIMLPILGGFDIISSMSHYYYLTNPSLYFIITLSSLALFLVSYKGYSRKESLEQFGRKEPINDDWLTNLAGLAALLVVLIPTACNESGSDVIRKICNGSCNLPLLGHNDKFTDSVHFISAAVFVFLMGYMSIFKFTRDEPKKSKRKLYRFLGGTVWFAILVLAIYFLAVRYFNAEKINNIVFWMEALAVVPFGISWIIKGEAMPALRKILSL